MHMWTLNALTTNKFYAAFDISFLPDSLSHARFFSLLSTVNIYVYGVPNVRAYMRIKYRNLSIHIHNIYKVYYVCLHGHFIALCCLISSYYSQHFSFYSCLSQFLKPRLVLLLLLLYLWAFVGCSLALSTGKTMVIVENRYKISKIWQ